MRRHSTLSILGAILLLLSLPLPGMAQGRFDPRRAPGLLLDANLEYVLISGEIGDSLKGGPGLEAALLYQLEGVPLRIGAGAAYSRHGVEESLEGGPIDGSADKFSPFALASLLLFSPDTEMIAYVQGRVGWTRIDTDAEGFNVVRSGIELGALAGVDIPLSERISLDFSGMFQWIAGGDASVDGMTIAGSSKSGSVFALRGGAFFSL